MRQLVVVEQRTRIVGHDELVGLLAVAHRVGILFVVLDEPDDLELQRLAVVRLDDKDVAQLQRSALAVLAGTVPGAVRTFDDESPKLVEVTLHVRVVLFERLRERVVSVTLVDVEQILGANRSERRIDRCLARIGDRRRR